MRLVALVASAAALAATAAVAASTPQAGLGFMKANAKKPGVVEVPGIQYRVIKSGHGTQPGRRDCVTVNYKGSFIDGRVFDQSKGKPVTFPLGAVIPGWAEGVQMMHEGDEWELVIPPGLAYGHMGHPAVRSRRIPFWFSTSNC